MIIEIILNPIFWIVEKSISLFPVLTLPDSFLSTMDMFFTLIASIGFFFPLNTLSEILSLFLIYFSLKLAISVFNFAIRKIPFIS